ncbi:MAG TPA: PAAR domain-containing protein [Pseudacidobacterium sp.]|jgi:uncharacterized Zn-binding protein involved in type VI secretion|nr:PAAR domain-containing protein [Pseudacidobacterium sp.]
MGMPACTITSQTAHGGIVTVGFPQVLINMMPASRIGDLHVCPMVTGIVPHVGGPFILGSMTVLTGFMPQSRVTDQLVCVGPPDVAVMGATTVLVGMAGAGGMAGAMGGLGALGAAVPINPSAATAAAAAQATLQPNSTVAIQVPPGASLPPMQLQQPGFPDLPPEVTATFQSVQPVTLPQGTQLFALADSALGGDNSFWSMAPPEIPKVPSDLNAQDIVKVLTVTAPDGLKAWAGQAASQAGQTMSDAQQQASQTASQAQQSVNDAMQQAQQQYKAAQSSVQQAQQAIDQAATQGKTAAQQAAQQGQQALSQAQQQVQQAMQHGQQAVQQAQQQAQQAQEQAKQALQQGQQAAQQAKQQTSQVWTSSQSAVQQAIQQFAAPRRG